MSQQNPASMALPPNVNLLMPMPIPGTSNAPLFNGRYPRDFIAKIELHGAAAGILSKDLLVDYIYDYSTDEVKAEIRFLPEFNKEKSGKVWVDAKAMLVALYGTSEAPPRVSEAQLTNFCTENANKAPFPNKKALETYYRNFLTLAAPLVENNDITPKARDSKFILGLPNLLRDWVVERLPEANRTKSDPPKIADTLKLLQTRYDPDSLLYSVSADSDRPLLQVRFEEPTGNYRGDVQWTQPGAPFPPRSPEPSGELDKLVQRMSELKLNSAQSQEFLNLFYSKKGNSLTNPSSNTSGRCFICGLVGTHPLHPSKCPQMALLLRDQLVVYNQERNRYVLPNGDDLPRTPPGYSGGVAQYLRAQLTDVNTQINARTSWSERDKPPHINPSNAASTNSIRLVYNGADLIHGKTYAVSSGISDASPALRSCKDTSNRFDPTKRSEESNQKGKSNTDQQHGLLPSNNPTGKPKANVQVPPPTHPINRPEGWKDSLPQKNQATNPQEVEMKDGTKKNTNNSGPQYHFTSNIQDTADPRVLYDEIMNQRVSVPVYQVIGSSPALQKLIGEATRTKRVYTSKQAEYYIENTDYETEHIDSKGNVKISSRLQAENHDILDVFLVKYGSAILQSEKLLAMVVGKFKLDVNGANFLAMIDTGSELNVTNPSFPQKANTPVDFEGAKWSLRGIHGDPEQLQGIVADAPIKIGSHFFPHHLFVSRHPIGEHDLILGQPFLHWYAAQMEYDKNGATKLVLWKDGDRTHPPTVSITITDPSDPRNTSKIGHQAAYIEDIADEDDFIPGFRN